MNPVLIVGSMALDDLELPCGSFPGTVGGSATYASLATCLFAPARIVAVVGDDFPSPWLDRLAAQGVDTRGVERSPGLTFRWKGRYAQDLSSRTTLDTQLNVFATFHPKIPEDYRDSRYLLLGNIHPELQAQVLASVKRPDFVALDTMNLWINTERASLEAVLPKVDLLLINDEEARLLGGHHNLALAAKAILALGPRRLVIKRGDAGALLFDQEGVFFAPALPLDLELDPTGAGDSFAGALLGQLARDGDLSHVALCRALWGAAATASFCVQGVGPDRLAAATPTELASRIQAVQQLISA